MTRFLTKIKLLTEYGNFSLFLVQNLFQGRVPGKRSINGSSRPPKTADSSHLQGWQLSPRLQISIIPPPCSQTIWGQLINITDNKHTLGCGSERWQWTYSKYHLCPKTPDILELRNMVSLLKTCIVEYCWWFWDSAFWLQFERNSKIIDRHLEVI